MYIGPARSLNEHYAAHNLVKNIWCKKNSIITLEYKKLIWKEPLFPILDNVVVAVSSDGQVNAVARILPRNLRCGSDLIKVAGISSVCVAEPMRGKGLSKELMMTTINYARSLGYDLVVLFARRAVDYFYPQFDIWGIANYSKVFIKFDRTINSKSKYSLRTFTNNDVENAMKWYEYSYSKTFGWFERTIEQWKFLLQLSEYQGMRWVVLEINGKDCGYAVLSQLNVVEIGLTDEVDTNEFIQILSPNSESIELSISQQHQFFKKETVGDLNFCFRRCDYGGHMVGVLNPSSLCLRLAKRIKSHAESIGLKARREYIDGLFLDWDGQNASVKIINNERSHFGLNLTARLVGASLAGQIENSQLAPSQPLNFLKLDEF